MQGISEIAEKLSKRNLVHKLSFCLGSNFVNRLYDNCTYIFCVTVYTPLMVAIAK